MNSDDLDWEPPSEADMKLIQARRERSDQISKLMSTYLLKGYKMLGSVCSKCDTILLQDRQGVNYCVACSELDSDNTKDDPVVNESAAMSMAKELELASAASSSNAESSLPAPSGAAPSSKAAASVTKQPAKTFSHFSAGVSSVGGSSSSSRPHNYHHPHHTDVKSEVLPTENSFVMVKDEPVGVPLLSMSSIDVQSYTATSSKTSPQQNPAPSSSPSQTAAFTTSVTVDSGISSLSTPPTTARQERLSSLKVTQVMGDHFGIGSGEDSVHIKRLIEKIDWSSQELQGTHSVEYSLHLCQLIKVAGEAIVALRNARV